MNFLLTTKEGLNEFTEFQDTPKLNDLINFNNQKYKVMKIEYFENHTELKVIEYPIKHKDIKVKWN